MNIEKVTQAEIIKENRQLKRALGALVDEIDKSNTNIDTEKARVELPEPAPFDVPPGHSETGRSD